MKWKKVKLGLLILFMLLIVLMILSPRLAKNYLVKNSPELIGRQLSLDKLKYNYFTSTLKAYDFRLFEANGEDVFVSFDTLILNLRPLKYIKGKIEVEQFYIDGLSATVVLKDSTFNFDDLIDFYLKDSIPVEVEPEEEVLKYAISNVELKNSSFSFDNKNVHKLTQLESLNIAVPYVGWDQEEKSSVYAHFNLNNGGAVETTVNIHPNSGDYDAAIGVENLNISAFYEYVTQYADINSVKGVLGANITIEGNTDNPSNATLYGDVSVKDFAMTDTTDKKFLGADNVAVELNKIDYTNSNYQLGKIEVNNSYTFFQLDSTSNNFFHIFKLDTPSKAPVQTQEENSSELQYDIAQLVVNGGVIDYTDNLTGKPFKYHLSQVAIDSDSINNSADWLNITSTMVLNNRGNLVAKVGLNPNDYMRNIDLDISIEKFLLPDINIYTNFYLGHNVVKGDLYYYSNSKISEGVISSENRLLVKDARLETRGSGLYSLPLKFAFFLLTDRNGDVNMEIPVKGNLNDPSLNISTIVGYAFKNLISKTVAAPANFLVNLVGGDPKELEQMTFGYTDTIPTKKHYRQLNKLLDLERKKPGLDITMSYYVDQNLYKEALAKEWSKKSSLPIDKDSLNDENQSKTNISKMVKTDSLSMNKATGTLAANLNLDSISEARTSVLLNNIKDYLRKGHLDTRIKVKRGELEAPENVGVNPMLKITYGLIDN